MPSPIENMIEALNLEVEAIKKNTSSSRLELHAGFRQGTVGSDTLYSFPLPEEPNLRDDSPVKIIIAQKEVDGTVVSVRNGVLTIALVQDLGEQIPFARLIVNDSFLIERLRDKLLEIQRGEFSFNRGSAEGVLTNCADRIAEADVPNVVFTLGKPLNAQQRRVVRQGAGSSLLYVWGPPGTGKTCTLGAVIHALYLQGKSVLLVSNTNIAVDTALERIGDRLCTLPEFHEAAVLRFGPIVSDTLRAKYQAQVDIDSVVERHSAALVERKKALKREATKVQDAILTLEEALKQYDVLRSATRELEHFQGQRQQLLAQVEQQEQSLGSLNHTLRQASADLQRAQSMGAIRKFFSGLNEDQLRRTLGNTQMRIKSCQDSLQSASAKVQQLQSQIADHTTTIAQLRGQLQRCASETQCRTDLDSHNTRLAQLGAEIKAIDIQIQALRQELLSKCRVLATTVYQSYLKVDVARPFDVVIVDEASMLALPMVYYAAGLAKEKVIVAGDFRQLPPIVLCDDPLCQQWLKRDVFFAAGIAEAVERREYPPTLVPLDEQFRMQDDVCGVVNHLFYGDRLKTAATVRSREQLRPFKGVSKGLLYVDTAGWNPWTAFRLGTYSRYNVLHALLIRNIAAKLKRMGFLGPLGEVNDRLGIVAPYSAQCRLLAQLIGEALNVRGSMYAATIHRFQGNERDAIICDLTDSTGARVGKFIRAESLAEDGARLLNVALSRARSCTLLVANFRFLRDKLSMRAYARGILDYFERHGQALDVSDCFPFKPEEIMRGHQAATDASTIQIDQKGLSVLTAGTFFPAFEADCRAAEREIVIFSPFMTGRGTGRWVELLRAKINAGVRVRLVTRPPGDQGGVLEHGLPELIDSLRKMGVVVDERARMHEKLAFIDRHCLWHGSLNILSHHDTSESMLRVESPGACEQVGSFVVGRKWGGKEDLDLAREENPRCVSCGRPMVWNDGKFGIWFQCECGHKADASGRPRRLRGQRSAQPAIQPSTATTALGNCPQCGKPLREKTGRYGRFIGCSGWPRCKYKPGTNRQPRPTSTNSQTQTPPRPTTGNSPPKTSMPARPAGPISTPITSAPPKPPRTGSVSTRSTSQPPVGASRATGTSVSVEERTAVLTALDKAEESLGTPLLSLKSKIGQRRLEEILPVLMREGFVKRLETAGGVRYSRA